MRFPVLIERIAGKGFRASGGEPLPLSVEGATRDEAVDRLRALIAGRLARGAELIGLELDPDPEGRGHPLAPLPGWSEDDPLLDEWQEAVAEYRREVEADPGRP